ncbi:LysR family transcriptional regulator [Pseudomonas oryzihabitans]|uniref:LysR family transcriptional regulator n=1 Tax=Pseudomonas rhizoryzae TaxID=2571129 RepID=UPI0007364702|nr:LysR family transcriptional regulator [Pseudomonas rhizoryzae]APQ10253.1 LysR family transcriptional regulator [Pseudomonas psychrotolerans]KTS79426.1 LysR family transcriptional regulator [Pseudomonas psychrotolerans]KTT40190.1 LysR family transcriptional regulator [Pseudomonas psychrotolerans]KTT42549.1 LysR family transcriptional regulator [Pseudomonas psychrotolerans]KTT67348.1 LysR family transcriptional regulator [Pseudomonas psychrotolerans]
MAFTSETLRVFLAVIDEGSFSAAARALGRVPSAVNMAISQLEAELDLVLFDRATRKALPTPAARALEPQARQVASQLNLLDAHALQLHAGLERRFVLVMAPELQTGAWSRPLATLAEEFPALEIEIRSAARTEAIRLLHEGSVDVALIFERPGIDEHEGFAEAGSQLLTAVAAPGYPSTRAGHPLGETLMADTRQIVAAGDDRNASDPQIVLSHRVWLTDSYLATLDLVQAGLGWAYLPHPLVRPLIAAGLLEQVQFDNMASQIRRWIDVIWIKNRPQGLGARRYLQLLREQIGTKPE